MTECPIIFLCIFIHPAYLLIITSSDLVEAGQHPDHEAGWHGDGVPGLLQHHLVPPHDDLGLGLVKQRLLGGWSPQLDVVVYARGCEDGFSGMRLDTVDHVSVSLHHHDQAATGPVPGKHVATVTPRQYKPDTK